MSGGVNVHKEPLNVKIAPSLGEKIDMLGYVNGCGKSEVVSEILEWYFSQTKQPQHMKERGTPQ